MECRAYEEAQLRCELLRAQIRSVDRESSLRASIVRRTVLRADCILVATLLAFGWNFVGSAQPQPAVLSAVVAIITVIMLSTARALSGQLN